MLSINNLAGFYPPILDEYTPYYTLTPLKAVFAKSISAFRRREYFHEGLRWFDIKRFNLEVSRTFNGVPVTLEKEDLRKQLQIPRTAQNFGVEANPR